MTLEQKIKEGQITIGVIGLGYVGLPLAVEYAAKGYATIGVDVDSKKVAAINKGKNYIDDVDSALLAQTVKQGALRAEDHYKSVAQMDVIFICVPTPFTETKDPDISYIINAAEGIAAGLRKDVTVTFAGDKMITQRKGKVLSTWTYKLDETKAVRVPYVGITLDNIKIAEDSYAD